MISIGAGAKEAQSRAGAFSQGRRQRRDCERLAVRYRLRGNPRTRRIFMSITIARALVFVALTFGASTLTAPPAAAQALPAGSYQQTCTQLHWSGTTLVAECRTRDGRTTGTGLANAPRCVGDIWNDNGQLRCNYAGAAPSYPAQPPQGYGAPPVPAPGYAPQGPSGYDERRARCEELGHRQHELRERLEATPYGPEREHLEDRLHDVHHDRERLGCGE
jgi:hypothetical protein